MRLAVGRFGPRVDLIKLERRVSGRMDNTLGNTKKLHPIRACLAEVEYLSNEDVDRMFNRGNFETLHQNVANAIASAIVADLESRK